MADNSKQIYQQFKREFMAQGMTEEQAWAKVRQKAENTIHNYFSGVMKCINEAGSNK